MRQKTGHNPKAKIIPAKKASATPVAAPAKKMSTGQSRPGEIKYKIDDEFLSKVKKLGHNNATYADAALYLGMSHQNFGRLIRENEKVAKAFESGKAMNRISLRQKLTDLALNKDNIAAAIFLAKQSEANGGLGMSDRAEVTGKDGGPIEIRFLPGDEDL